MIVSSDLSCQDLSNPRIFQAFINSLEQSLHISYINPDLVTCSQSGPLTRWNHLQSNKFYDHMAWVLAYPEPAPSLREIIGILQGNTITLLFREELHAIGFNNSSIYVSFVNATRI